MGILNIDSLARIKHSELVKLGARWLRNHKKHTTKIPRCPQVAEELVTLTRTGEQPDIVGWNYWCSIMIEVKVTRRDFNKDKYKPFRQQPSLGTGQLKYYLAPRCLIKTSDLPKNWGLLEIDTAKRITVKQFAEFEDCNLDSERTMLVSALRRQDKELKKLRTQLKKLS